MARQRPLQRRQPDAVAEIAKPFAGDAVGGIEREERVKGLADFLERHLVGDRVLSRVPSKSPPTNSA